MYEVELKLGYVPAFGSRLANYTFHVCFVQTEMIRYANSMHVDQIIYQLLD